MTRIEELEELIRTLGASEAHLKAQNADLLVALKKLQWPNVPSADDFRMLIIGIGGNTPTAKKCEELADRLEEAQKDARAAIKKAEEL